MSEHTKGRLAYQEQSDAYTHILRDEGGRFVLQLSQDTTGHSEANARRLAACWNACDGMSTASIEALAGVGSLGDLKSNELAAARALLRELITEAGTISYIEKVAQARDYLDACDTLGSGHG